MLSMFRVNRNRNTTRPNKKKGKNPSAKERKREGKKEKLCLSIYPFIYTQVSSTSTFFNDLCLNQCSLHHDSPALNQ